MATSRSADKETVKDDTRKGQASKEAPKAAAKPDADEIHKLGGWDKGYRGDRVDETPDDAYTISGVTSGEPTPETDADLARKRRHELEERGGKF